MAGHFFSGQAQISRWLFYLFYTLVNGIPIPGVCDFPVEAVAAKWVHYLHSLPVDLGTQLVYVGILMGPGS